MGLLFQHGPERDKWWVQGLKKHVKGEDIIFLWCELITDEPIVPQLPQTIPPTPMVEPIPGPCIQDVDILDVEDMCRNLFYWGMSPDHESPIRGESLAYQESLKENTSFDWCDDLDRMNIALHFIENDVDERDIGFIKGFVSSRDPIDHP